MNNRTILQGDALHKLSEIEDNSIDLIATDPPYGYSFMNKDWDKAVVSVDIWKQCLRVLKPGAWAYVMSAPRQDVLSHMTVNLSDAGFNVNYTSMYWAYASGFPKAMNISKAVDKRNGRDSQPYKELGNYLKTTRLKAGLAQSEISKHFPSKTGGLTGCVSNWELGANVPTSQQWQILKQKLELDNSFDELIQREEAQREVIGVNNGAISGWNVDGSTKYIDRDITKPETPQAKALDGSYAGYQPKPAVEVILVAMKPLSEKNYVEQAMSNNKGVTWLDDVRIPYRNDDDYKENWRVEKGSDSAFFGNADKKGIQTNNKGRFPANLLVSDDSLDIGKKTKNTRTNQTGNKTGCDNFAHRQGIRNDPDDEGDFSRYYSLDAWEAQFIVTPKPSKSEKNKGLDSFLGKTVNDGRDTEMDTPYQRGETVRQNVHPTVKPVSLFKYLITMGSRPNDTVLDPFLGSGTTAIAAELTARNWIGIELNPEYEQIIRKRIATLNNSRLDDYISL